MKKVFAVCLALCTVLFCALPCAAAYHPTFEVSAKAGILVSLDTGVVLYEKNIDEKMYPASLTKIMTAVLMLESPLYDAAAKVAMRAEVDPYITGTGSAVSSLKVGEEITHLDLLHYLLVSSAGDCAYLAAMTFAETVEQFVENMNAKAQELGLSGTHYGNPVGLHDEATYTTVRDVYTLAKYALQFDDFKETCGQKRYTVAATNMGPARTLSTTNFLIDNNTNYYYAYATGLKTGFTDEAGRCLVSTASYDGYNYLAVLMDCPNGGTRREFVDSADLYRWAFKTFRFAEVADTQNPVTEMPVRLAADTDFVPVYVEKTFVTVLPKDADMSTVRVVPNLTAESVDAPVKKGQNLGTADFYYAEQKIGSSPLVAGANVKRSTWLYLWDRVKAFLASKAMKLVYLGLAAAVVLFIAVVCWMNRGRTKKRKVRYIPYKEDEENESK